MTEVTVKHPVKIKSGVYRAGQISKGAYEMDKKGQIDRRLTTTEGKFKKGIVELDSSKRELTKMKNNNKDIKKKIEEMEDEKKSLSTKINALKVKLGLANANLNTTNDEKESLRTKLDEAQITVARLEERLAHSSSELDRLRDPANPDSNMSIKKHIANDKKEIKRLKAEIETELNSLDIDNNVKQEKQHEINILERELGRRQADLDTIQLELSGVQAIEEAEKQKKAELNDLVGELSHEKKSYPTRLKHVKVRLGISNAGQNVSSKLAEDMKSREREMQRELNGIERKLKEATGSLDILRNQHKMSKTAHSINQYTRRNQMKRGVDDIQSLAQSGPGPIKFGGSPRRSKEPAKVKSTSGASSLPESSRSDNSRYKDTASLKSQSLSDRNRRRESHVTLNQKSGNDSKNKSDKSGSDSKNKSDKYGSDSKNKSEQLVPQPKAKIKR